MALVCQMYRLLVKLPNFSSCFINFIKAFIKIFELQTILPVVKLPDTNDYCQDIFNR